MWQSADVDFTRAEPESLGSELNPSGDFTPKTPAIPVAPEGFVAAPGQARAWVFIRKARLAFAGHHVKQ
jgi:hypothetical protein